jgi:O-antigen/teichoic acid export membrane protein
MSIAHNSSSVLKRDVFLYVTRIFTSAVIARKLGPDMLGVSTVLFLIPSFAEAFGRMKFDVAAVYFLGKQKYGIGEVVWTLNVLALVTGGLIVAVVLWQFDWLYGLLFSKSSLDARYLLYLVLLGIPLQFLWMNYSYLLLHKDDIVTYNWMVIIKALISSLVAIALLLLFDLGLWAVVGASVLGILLSLVFGLARFGPAERKGPRLSRPLLRDLFQYASQLYGAGLVGQLQMYLSNLLVATFLAPAQVAFFSLARSFGDMIDRVPASLNTILFPRLTKIHSQEEAAGLAARAFRSLLVVLAAVGVAAAVFVFPAVYVVYGSEYLPLAVPFLVLLPGVLVAGTATPFMQYFMSVNRADLGITLPIAPLVVQVLLAFWLIPKLGAVGAAVAFSSGLLLSAGLNIWMFLRLSACTARGDLAVRGDDVRTILQVVRQQCQAGLSPLLVHKVV